MRPVTRGPSPITTDFAKYEDAYIPLVGRLGHYCSYCERKIPTNLAVEHIQPKGFKLSDGTEPYRSLEKKWINFLLGCVNCNSTKKDKDVVLSDVILPDRDNTFSAFTYTANGRIAPSSSAPAGAAVLIALTGIDKKIRQSFDDNGKLIATDRSSQRMQAWGTAQRSLTRWKSNSSIEVKEMIVEAAREAGFFSIWMTVFSSEPTIRQALIEGFQGTARDCFDPVTTTPISPRPTDPVTGLVDGLAHGGKI